MLQTMATLTESISSELELITIPVLTLDVSLTGSPGPKNPITAVSKGPAWCRGQGDIFPSCCF